METPRAPIKSDCAVIRGSDQLAMMKNSIFTRHQRRINALYRMKLGEFQVNPV
jgi:hypothetical protein